MGFGKGDHSYEVVEGWGKHFFSPFIDVSAVGSDSRDKVYVLVRGLDPILVFDSEGNFIKSWGRKYFTRPHGLYLGQDDSVYCTDGDHTVRKFNPEGQLLMNLGTKNQPSDTGCVEADFPEFPDYRMVKKAAGPFFFPTDVAVDREDNLFISDGYGNARIHKFSKEGEYLLSWGEPGDREGQFNLPHGVCTDREGRVYVADRENCRIQVFNPEGKFVNQWNSNRPTDIFIKDDLVYVSEYGYPTRYFHVFIASTSIFNLEGELITRWGDMKGQKPGNFFAPHGLCVDSKGSIYVGETVTGSIASLECHTLQKFILKKG